MKFHSKFVVYLIVGLAFVYDTHAFYDPSIQRWPNRDPICEMPSTQDCYAMVKNDTVNSTDLYGLWKIRNCTPTEEGACRQLCQVQNKDFDYCEKSARREYIGKTVEGNKVTLWFNVIHYTNCQCKDKPKPDCIDQNAPPKIIEFPRFPKR